MLELNRVGSTEFKEFEEFVDSQGTIWNICPYEGLVHSSLTINSRPYVMGVCKANGNCGEGHLCLSSSSCQNGGKSFKQVCNALFKNVNSLDYSFAFNENIKVLKNKVDKINIYLKGRDHN